MKMPKLNIARSFLLTLDDGKVKAFEAGVQIVEKEFADHWYVKAHVVGFETDPKPDSLEYGRIQGEKLAEEAAAEAARQADEAAAKAAEDAARQRAVEEKIQESIAASAKQALAIATKDDPKPAHEVTELPAMQLSKPAVEA
jgi:hypothetical protein